MISFRSAFTNGAPPTAVVTAARRSFVSRSAIVWASPWP